MRYVLSVHSSQMKNVIHILHNTKAIPQVEAISIAKDLINKEYNLMKSRGYSDNYQISTIINTTSNFEPLATWLRLQDIIVSARD